MHLCLCDKDGKEDVQRGAGETIALAGGLWARVCYKIGQVWDVIGVCTTPIAELGSLCLRRKCLMV